MKKRPESITSRTVVSTSISAETVHQGLGKDSSPLFPVETEIYILPDGQVVVADLPAELAHLAGYLNGLGTADLTQEADHGADQ
jgi:hypothetical protein